MKHRLIALGIVVVILLVLWLIYLATRGPEPSHARYGFLRVITVPSRALVISIDNTDVGTWGVWQIETTGVHRVCFRGVGPVPCEVVVVPAGRTVKVSV